MYANRIWIFDVEHGAMVFIRSSSGPTLVLDCGKGSLFSPSRYIFSHELTEEERRSQNRITQLVVSHPHDDHIEDIEDFKGYLRPWNIHRQQYNWDHVKAQSAGDYQNLTTWAEFQSTFNSPVWTFDWGPVSFTHWYLTVPEAIALNPGKYINNSSIVTVVRIGAFKLTFPGDLESDGWDLLLQRGEFRQAIADTYVFVTPHHGHGSGYNPGIYQAMGRPWFNLSSIHHGDESIAAQYSQETSAKGVKYNGLERRSFTTRRDGSCLITVSDLGEWNFGFYDLGINLLPPLSSARR